MDTSETIFYKSPVGALEISCMNGNLTRLHYVSTDKYGKADETKIMYSSSSSAFMKKVITEPDDYFGGRNLVFDLALIQPGTIFQQNVWTALCNIKPGTTISDLQLSRNLGDVRAIRAVGTANGKNNIAIIVPCHS